MWGLARITSPDPLSTLRIYPCYRHEPEMNVDIYIVDTGILVEHEEFKSGRATCEFVAVDAGNVCTDDEGHGTHVAGIAGGNVYGVAKKAKLIGVKVLDARGFGTVAGILSGLQWIWNQVKNNGRPSVINMSLGGGVLPAVDNGVRALLDLGIPVVAAAGNSYRTDACNTSPARIGGQGGKAVTVMASDINDAFADFSDCGPCADIIAPGVNILSAVETAPNAYDHLDGTSMAAPYVCGVIARYLAQNPHKTPAELKAWVVSQAIDNAIGGIPSVGACVGTRNKLLHAGCYI